MLRCLVVDIVIERGDMHSVRLIYESFWQGPKVGGILFGAVIMVVLFLARSCRVKRERRNHAEECRKSAEKHAGLHMSRDPMKSDKPIHVDAHTIPLGLKKMVKTGTSCDKGIME